jgi:hypothetical protein
MFCRFEIRRSFGWLILILATCVTLEGAEPRKGTEPRKIVQAAHQEFDAEESAHESTQETTTSSQTVYAPRSYSPKWPEPPNTGALLLRLAIGTVVVLGLCVVTLRFGKPWLQRLQNQVPTGTAITVEGSVTLGNRAVLYLVRIGDVRVVAGTDFGGLKSVVALSPSFKEVLDQQIPETELQAETSEDQADDSKE